MCIDGQCMCIHKTAALYTQRASDVYTHTSVVYTHGAYVYSQTIHKVYTRSADGLGIVDLAAKKNLAGGGVSTRTPGSHRAPGQQSTFGIGGMD